MSTNVSRSGYEPEFLAPRGRGRPPIEVGLPYKINRFNETVDYFHDSLSIPGFTKLKINTRCKFGRTLNRRDSHTNFGAVSVVESPVYMEAVLEKLNDADIYFRIVNGATTGVQLQYYNTTTSAWTDIGSEIGDANYKKDWFWTSIVDTGVEYLIFTCGEGYVYQTDGNTVSSINTDISARYVTRLENILIFGHMTAVHARNELVYSKAGDRNTFKRDTDEDYAHTSQKIMLDGEITQVRAFGSWVYAFTKYDGLWKIDMSTAIPIKISEHGTHAPKSVAIGADAMFWAGQKGVYRLPLGSDNAEKISDNIDYLYKSSSLL